MDEPLAEHAAYFRRKARLPDQELIRVTAAARAGGSRWDVIAAACGIQTCKDLAGVIFRITGDTGAELLFSATQYAIGQFEDITQISRGEAEQIAAELAARYWPPDTARLPWVLSAYPEDTR